MSGINLLPWREELRKELQTQFFVTSGFVALFAVVVWLSLHFYHKQLLEVGNWRIDYIQQQIVLVDKKIKEIEELEKEKQRLLSRMRSIEELQVNRPLVVRLFDEIVLSLPEGVTVTNVEQKGNVVTIQGLAQSNARVSSFMRQLESSEWLTNPQLKIIRESDKGGNKPVNSFVLTVRQVMQKGEETGDV